MLPFFSPNRAVQARLAMIATSLLSVCLLHAEPDNSVAEARTATFDQPVDVAFETKNDIDWFKLTIPAQGIVSWSDSEEKFTPYAYYCDAQGKTYREGDQQVRVFPGDFYVCFRSHQLSWERKEVAPFQVTFRFEKETDPSEPNDILAKARAVPFDQPISFALVPRDEKDWFVLSAPGPGTVTWASTGFTPHVVFCDEKGNTLRSNERDFTVAAAGNIYLYAMSHQYSWELKPVPSLQITFSFQTQADPSEPANNQRQGARPVKAGSTVELQLVPRGDPDWFVFDLPTAGVMRVSQSGWTGTQNGPFLSWYTEENEKPFAYGWNPRLTAGRTYLNVASAQYAWHLHAVSKSFSLSFQLEDEKDAFEPNDKLEQAAAIKIGKTVEATFVPKGDIDFYALEVEKAGIVQVTVENYESATPYIVQVVEGVSVAEKTRDFRVTKGMNLFQFSYNHPVLTQAEISSPFRFTFRHRPDPDPFEPANNTFVTAPKVEVGAKIQTWLSPKTDLDIFRVTVPAGQRLTWEFFEVPPDALIHGYVLDEEGKLIEKPSATPQDVYLQVRIVTAQTPLIDPIQIQLGTGPFTTTTEKQDKKKPLVTRRWSFTVEKQP